MSDRIPFGDNITLMRPLHPAERDQIERLLALPEDRLLTVIGYSLPEATTTLFGPREAREQAAKWLDRVLRHNREQICGWWHEISGRERFDDDTTLAAALADFLVALALEAGGFTVAVLLVKRGLKKLCTE